MTKEETKITKHSGDAFDSYTESVNNAGIASSYSVGINSAYTMSYSDDTKSGGTALQALPLPGSRQGLGE